MEIRKKLTEYLIVYLIAPVCCLAGAAVLLRHAMPMTAPESSVSEAKTADNIVPANSQKPVPVQLGDVFETMSDATELDLSWINVSELDMDGFLDALPKLRRITMRYCGLDNDGYAALQDAHPDVKIIWDIHLQNYVLSTDAVGFSTLLANEKQPRLTNDDQHSEADAPVSASHFRNSSLPDKVSTLPFQ